MLRTCIAIGLLVVASFGTAQSSSAAIVYDSIDSLQGTTFSELNSTNLIFGDSLTLSQPGTLTNFGAAIYNPSHGSGNTGPIQTGTMLVTFYDNTVPYTAGVLSDQDPVLGQVTLTWDFTGIGGLAPGAFQTGTFDLSQFSIHLPKDILVTQQFTQTTGDSIANGTPIFQDPTVGFSPTSVYIKSSDNPEGLYALPAGDNAQFGYKIEVAPAPEPNLAAVVFLGIGAMSWGRNARRRRRCTSHA